VHRPNSATRLICALFALASLLVATELRADVTIRYKSEFHMQAIPGSNAQNFVVPPVSLIQIKGNNAYSNLGAGASLVDSATQQVTLLDAAHKLFATVLMKDYASELASSLPTMPNLPPAAQQILESMTADFSSRKTGRTDMILGIQAEETEWTLSIALPLPPGLPLPPEMFPPGQPVKLVKMVIQVWSAAQEEIARVPALTEWMAYSSSSSQLMNPFATLQQLAANLPGIGKSLAPALQQLTEHKSALLKSHLEIYVPVLAQIAPLAQAQGHPLPPEVDPNAPLAVADTLATEISNAPVADSVFHVPDDYHATTLAVLLKSMAPAPTTTAPLPTPSAR